MKTGELILGEKIINITFEKLPTINLGFDINADGTKQFNGQQKWDTLKINLYNKYTDEIINGYYDVIYLSEDYSSNYFKFTNCEFLSNMKELKFKNCQLISEF
jgi:hypothetical protein